MRSVAFALVLAAGGASAAPAIPTDPTPHTCDQRSAERHYTQARQVIRAGWSLGRWQAGPKPEQRREVARHIGCLERKRDRAKIQTLVKSKQAKLRLYRRYREVAPFTGYQGRGIWTTHLAVPRYIVDCESRGSWFAYNSSGASWLYQLLGWGAPYPGSAEAKVRNHEIAHSVSGGSRNFSPWACA